jgi:hypothetical protein
MDRQRERSRNESAGIQPAFIVFVNCVLCASFWGSAIFAVWLYRRLNGSLTIRQGVNIGVLTGLLAGLIGFGLSFDDLTGA